MLVMGQTGPHSHVLLGLWPILTHTGGQIRRALEALGGPMILMQMVEKELGIFKRISWFMIIVKIGRDFLKVILLNASSQGFRSVFLGK